MVKLNFKYDESYTCNGYLWETENPKGVIVITHGMAEHTLRYNDFGVAMAEKGFNVYAFDLIGHGYSRKSEDQKVGDLGVRDFCGLMLDCMHRIYEFVKEREVYTFGKSNENNLPIYLFAHSMGSMLAQRYIQVYPNDYKKVILSGTDIGNFKYGFLRFLTGISLMFGGVHKYSKFINALTLDGFDAKFKDENQSHAWLTSNKEKVLNYEADPLCGANYPVVYYNSLAKNLMKAYKNTEISKINAEKILLITGEFDPVTNFTKSPLTLQEKYANHDIVASIKIFRGARHEMLNETPEIVTKAYKIISEFYSD